MNKNNKRNTDIRNIANKAFGIISMLSVIFATFLLGGHLKITPSPVVLWATIIVAMFSTAWYGIWITYQDNYRK